MHDFRSPQHFDLFFIILSVAALFITDSNGEATLAVEFRTWTSTSGTTIEAVAVGIKQEQVGLKKLDGQILPVKLSLLVDEDIAFLHTKFPGHADLPPIPGKPQVSSALPTDFSTYSLGEVHGPLAADSKSSYYIYLPKTLKKDRLASLLLFTGSGGGKASLVSKLIPAAERCGIVLATSIESKNGNSSSKNNHEHSMSCVKHIAENFPINSKRVYFAGGSGGGATAMWNATEYKGAIGAMPINGYLSWEFHDQSRTQDRHFVVLGGATDFNRYLSADIVAIHNRDAIHRFGPKAHEMAEPDLQNEGICWLQGRYMNAHRNDQSLAAERLDFEAAMIAWIEELKESKPYRAHYWCDFLVNAYQITGHNLSIVKTVQNELNTNPANSRYTTGIAALSQYSIDYLAGHRLGSEKGHTLPKAVAAAQKFAKEYDGVPEIVDLFRELGKPTVGGKKKK